MCTKAKEIEERPKGLNPGDESHIQPSSRTVCCDEIVHTPLTERTNASVCVVHRNRPISSRCDQMEKDEGGRLLRQSQATFPLDISLSKQPHTHSYCINLHRICCSYACVCFETVFRI